MTFGRALTYSFHMSVMSEVLSEDRTQDSEVKGDCANEARIHAMRQGLKIRHFWVAKSLFL